jgi:hypothetical protein
LYNLYNEKIAIRFLFKNNILHIPLETVQEDVFEEVETLSL